MRFARTVVLAVVGLLWLGLGPVVPVLGALSLLLRPVRDWLRPTRRVVLAWVAAVAVLGALAVAVPDGWVRIPPGAGAWATPSYVGRPAGGAGERGPVGESPTVRSTSYGVDDCRRLDPIGTRLVAICGGDAPVVRLVDAESLRQVASADLDGRGCSGRLAVVGDRVVASSGHRLFTLDLPDLVVRSSVDLGPRMGADDCVTGVGADDDGRIWFGTREGLVGVVAGDRARFVDLDDEVDRPLTVVGDGADVAGADALHRIGLVRGKPAQTWATAYDDGGRRGSAPVLLPHGLVAVADNRDPRLQVVLHRADTGAVVCRAEVFDDDEGATDGGLVAAGDGVVVSNSRGYGGPHSTVLGRTTSRGIALVAPDCTVTWTIAMDAPSGAPAVSVEDGLVYAWTKRHSWLGIDAWYLSALDLRTGRLVWARRTGLSALADNHGGAVTLGPGRAAYVPVLGGLVRVRDRG